MTGKFCAALVMFLVAMFFHTAPLQAQDGTQPLEIPYFTFGKGVGIISPDSLYLLNIRFRMQNRIGLHFKLDETDDRFELDDVEARIRRLRLRFDGFIYSDKLDYVIQLSFARGDLDFDDTGFPNIIRDALVTYSVTRNLRFGLGQTKLPGNRQRVNSSGDLQFTDRSIVNATFNFDRDFGVHAGFVARAGQSVFNTRAALSSGEGRNFNSAHNGLAYSGRIEWLPMGSFTRGGDYFEGDLEKEASPKLSIGLAGSYNRNASRTGGQLGKNLYEPRNITTLVADMIFKYRGFALAAEAVQRTTDKDPVTQNDEGDIRYVYTGQGLNTQVSYMFTDRKELAFRNSMLWPTEEIRMVDPVQHVSAAANYYLRGHRAKFQLEGTLEYGGSRVYESMTGYYLRFQIEVGI